MRFSAFLVAVFLLLPGRACLAQTAAGDTPQVTASAMPPMRVDSSRRILTDSFNQIVGFMDRSGRIELLHTPRETHRFDALYTFITWAIMLGLVCLGVVIVVATYRYVFAKKDTTPAGFSSDSWKYNITKIISLVLLGAFVMALVSLFFVNLETGADEGVNEKWFEIFKNMLLLLGTSFTTIMGYFFGQAQTASLEKKKDRLEEENRALTEATGDLSKQIEVITTPVMAEEIRQEPLPGNAPELHQEP